MNIRNLLTQNFQQAMLELGIDAKFGPMISISKKAGFGDYQANGAMAAAKSQKTNPRELAQKIIDQVDLSAYVSKLEIAGPGFINIHLKSTFLAQSLQTVQVDAKLGVTAAKQPQTVVVDYSSPNLAKQMHVGHLRSSVIGDAAVRVLEFLGHKVIRQNHVGDWGTQFGMLIAELEEQMQADAENFKLTDLEQFYQQSKQHFDADEAFANRARDYVVKLQAGDAKVLALWQKFKEVSLVHSREIYQTLNISLTDADVRGESAYNDDLEPVVSELKQLGLAQESDGAQVVFLEELADKKGNPSPVIIQKQDGGYLYATSDLAALRYRANTLKADRCLYFIDARQSLHMNQVFTLAKKANFIPQDISLEHHAFGTMMGEDGKPFKTRSGGTVKLAELLQEAIERAEQAVLSKNPELSIEQRQEIARKVGIGAVKYADLSKTRTNDYIFNWSAMLSFEGNTGPYLQYAYARIQSIFRKAELEFNEFSAPIELAAEQELALALKTLQFSEVIEQVAQEAYPHLLTTYLYELSSLFMSFYEACPILKQGVSEADKNSRLQLSQIVANTIATGLDLLGIEVMPQM